MRISNYLRYHKIILRLPTPQFKFNHHFSKQKSLGKDFNHKSISRKSREEILMGSPSTKKKHKWMIVKGINQRFQIKYLKITLTIFTTLNKWKMNLLKREKVMLLRIMQNYLGRRKKDISSFLKTRKKFMKQLLS